MVLVDRWTYIAKRGHINEAVALVKTESERYTKPRTYRVLRPNTGSMDTFVMEIEFESMEDRQRFWSEWGATPEAAAFLEKWHNLTETGVNREIWSLEE